MSATRPADARHGADAEPFAFTPENLERAKRIIAKYPEGRQQSAVIPLLDLAQRQIHNHLPIAAIEYVAGLLDIPRIRVHEVATFYTMFYLNKVGRFHLQVCQTTPCWLRGSDAVKAACERHLGITYGETTADGMFSLAAVECLGACVNAPVVQVNDDLYEDVDADSVVRLIEGLKAGDPPPVGTMVDRQTSAPVGGPTTLTGDPTQRPVDRAGDD